MFRYLSAWCGDCLTVSGNLSCAPSVCACAEEESISVCALFDI